MSLSVHCQFQYPGMFYLDVNVKCHDGITALCGPSGSGKTTLVNLIGGLIRPKSGHIKFHEKVFVDISAKEFLAPEARRLGIVFQKSLLFPHLTVKENLNFGFIRNKSSKFSLEKVVDLLEIGDLLQRRTQSLSGGQARRVALGRALLSCPEMLLLDEPFTGLDHALKVRIVEHLKHVAEEKQLPILLVSHDQEVVQAITNDIVYIENGRTV